MKPRIFGIETEYGLTAKVGPRWGLTSETAFNVIRHLFETIDLRDTNCFLENGARLYLDGGDHPEYATPECDDVMELVAHDKAGERILEERLRRAELRLGEEGAPTQIRLFKNNTDSAGNYYGCHENYLVRRDVDFARLSTALVPFLVTRQVFAGAGKAYQTRDGIQYCLSQRGQQPVFESAATPYPFIDTRDQPLADAARYRRLHVVIGDANMSEVATYLKVGTTALLLGSACGQLPALPGRARALSHAGGHERLAAARAARGRRRCLGARTARRAPLRSALPQTASSEAADVWPGVSTLEYPNAHGRLIARPTCQASGPLPYASSACFRPRVATARG